MPVDTDLIMEVRSGGATRRTHQCDQLPALHARIVADQDLRKMAVAGGDALAMIDLDHVAITAHPLRMGDDAVCGGIDRSADRTGDVDPGVHRGGAPEGIAA